MNSCPSCGRELEGDFAFCPYCGATLTATASPAHAQRKVVSVLFCDVTGSTELGEQLDPEALRALLARYFEQMKAIVERHGGSVEKFIGDAVMAVFGVPVVHEDDADRHRSTPAGGGARGTSATSVVPEPGADSTVRRPPTSSTRLPPRAGAGLGSGTSTSIPSVIGVRPAELMGRCAPPGIRTQNLRIKSPLLCR